ncbi:MAG: YkgJ family cysteine cluster protein [Thermodesulfobacteriota bacterium]|nr:YkgJ family cysteine cluster protein [Thermodesulfobacteriota bacterium]
MLQDIYRIYENFSKGMTTACKRGCATCCTQNVTVTTLESYDILRHLTVKGKMDLLDAVHRTAQERRFQPTLSINALAALCSRGEEPPEEHTSCRPMACPFLHHNECLIYENRPFGCRCFVSARPCKDEACAVVDPFLVTANTVFLQFIEHVDARGLFGNMSDVILFLEPAARRLQYESQGTFDHLKGRHGGDDPHHLGQLARNRPIPVLLAPPEHQEQLQPILEELGKIRMTHIRFGNKGRT